MITNQMVTNQETAETKLLTITARAAEKALGALASSGKADAAIRVFVKSGGCSGYQYGMAIDDRRLDGDTIVEDQGVRLVVDRMSLPYLSGAEVDFVNNLMGAGFTINNPNATSSCGCGHSFRTDGQRAPEGGGSGGCGSH